MNRLYSQLSQLGQHNAELVLKNIDANAKMADLGARQQALEEELARVGERDVQMAAAEEKAREAEAQAACNTWFIKGHKPSNHIRARIKSHVYTTE